GGYAVRAVRPELSVTARAGDFRPALLRPLDGRAGRVRLDFVLEHEGAGLHGIVRDPRGRPVAGALVAVGDPRGWAEGDPEHPGLWIPARGMRVVETDTQGRFLAAGVQTGFGLAVAVQAEEYPLAVANVSAQDGTSAFVEVQLEEPAVLSGVVRTSSGAPVAGVTLAAVQLDGAGADEIPFALPRATSDADGRYRLELLPRTSVLRLDPPPGGASTRTLVSFELGPGEAQRDLVLAADDVVRGRVVATAGTPLDGWFVRAYEQLGVARIRRAKVGADGRFELAGCSAPPYRLELYAATDRPLVRLEGVGPGPEIELEVEPLGSIQGEFVDEAGLLPPSVLPDIYRGVQEYVGPTWSEHGRFDFEQLRPGRYRLTIEHDEHLLFTRWVDLAPGEHVDLGRIASVPLGSL